MDEQLQKTAKLSGGVEISYRLHKGNGENRFALIHSLAMNGDFWRLMVAPLLEAGDVLIYDCRGHGRSSKPAGPYRVEQFAEDLAALFDEVSWSSAVVAGASMGGCVALAFAAAYPEKVDGIGLIDTTAWYGAEASVQWEERAQKAISDGLGGLVDFQKTRWFSDEFRAANPDIVNQSVAVFLANDVTAYAESCRMLGRCDKRTALPDVRVPTVVLVGSEDYAAPVSMAKAMAEGIPGAELQVIEGVRHLTPLECPHIVAAKLLDVVGRS